MPELKARKVRVDTPTAARICSVEDVSESARTLSEIQAKILIKKFKEAHPDIWDWYQDKKGGHCYG